MKHLRSHLTYANAMATIAVFIALGGGAYAMSKKAPPNSVNSKAIINGQVKSRDIAMDSIGNDQIAFHGVGSGSLQNGLISGQKLAPITQVSKSKTLNEGDFGSVYVSCKGDSVLISGGAEIDPQNEGSALYSSFQSNPNTWLAAGTNPSAQHTATLTAYADCLGDIASSKSP